MRSRSAVLEALELLRETAPAMTLSQIICFLQVADEQAPLPLPDLQRRTEISAAQAWRNIQALARPQPGVSEGLVEIGRWKTGSTTAAELSASGLRLATALDDIVLRANRIAPPLQLAGGDGMGSGK